MNKSVYSQLMKLSDFGNSQPPLILSNLASPSTFPSEDQRILRMLIRPKYGRFRLPASVQWLKRQIQQIARLDKAATGIKDAWCYLTVRHSKCDYITDDEWHFDGASFRTDLIPDRNYIWCSHTGTQYKTGRFQIPSDFDPMRHNLSEYAIRQLAHAEIESIPSQTWAMMTPYLLHRRNPITQNQPRTFIRVTFVDVEIRDVNNTQNPILPSDAYGRDPVREFRDYLKTYPTEGR